MLGTNGSVNLNSAIAYIFCYDYENLFQEMCAININLDYYWRKS